MGLSLNYRLTLPGDTAPEEVRHKLAALKAFAESLEFDGLFGPSEYTLDELMGLPWNDIVNLQATGLMSDPPEFYELPSDAPCVFAFAIAVGEECEPAAFALLAPGRRSDIGGPHADLCPTEWFWSSSCKTQYASVISDAHFLRCHLNLVRVLDHAASLGIGVDVFDESGYWDHRSPEELLEAVRNANRIMARVAGAITDQLGATHKLSAPIFNHPDFEHLEMEDIVLPGQADGTR